MKKILFAFGLLAAVCASAQDKYILPIKQGSTLSYNILVNGQTITSIFSLDSISSDFVKVGWNIDQLGTGSWVMKTKSINEATRGYWGQPAAGVQEDLPGDQSVLFFSKVQWGSLQKDKKLVFDGHTFTVKQASEKQQVKLGDNIVDAILLETQNGATRIWILNNPSFPILVKIEGNPAGPDLTLETVSNKI